MIFNYVTNVQIKNETPKEISLNIVNYLLHQNQLHIFSSLNHHITLN